MGKKKILIFTPGAVGGAERMCITIGSMLPCNRFDVHYVILGKEKRIYELIPKGANVDCIPFRKIYEFVTLRIWWKIIKSKPDLVYSSLALFNPRVIIAAKFARRKVIIRSSGMVGDYNGFFFLKVLVTYPFADLLIAQQEEMRQQIVELLNVPPEKIVTINNPIDFVDINQKKNAPSPFPLDGSVCFVNSARVNYAKGQDVAIKAMKKVRKSLCNAHLYFVGGYKENDSYYKSLIELINELDLNDCVHFVGFDSNPFRWVRNCDCFVFPSRMEGLPNALIEASYLGVPCVATRCLRVINEIVRNGYNGYIVDVDNVDEMAVAMVKAISLKECKMIYRPTKPEDFAGVFDRI